MNTIALLCAAANNDGVFRVASPRARRSAGVLVRRGLALRTWRSGDGDGIVLTDAGRNAARQIPR